MNSPIVLTVLLFAVVCVGNAQVSVEDIRTASNSTAKILATVGPSIFNGNLTITSRRLRWAIRRNLGCNVRVCFAIEGSNRVSDDNYRLQLEIAALSSAIISTDTRAEISAVQYSSTTFPIQDATKKVNLVVDSILKSKRNNENNINLGTGLAYCGFQVRNAPGQTKGVVVVIGSGRFTSGFEPDLVANAVLTDSEIVFVKSTGQGAGEVFLKTDRRDGLTLRKERDIERILNSLIPAVCSIKEATQT